MNTPVNPYAAPASDLNTGLAPLQFPELDYKTLRRLRNDSLQIRSFGALMVLTLVVSGVVSLLLLGDAVGWWRYYPIVPVIAALAAYACLWRPTWGRWVLAATAVLVLPAIPIGTAAGILGLVSLRSASKLFGADAYPNSELDSEFRYRRKHKIRG
ncbi:hypothetical protein SAMN02745857_01486 [Andreprevotia lacus DSM 23236]|jgi:hypothetical protein|uniref:Uncharacterized protein n=1 Tax=Andreprevotia lacus DSM 23236 TaxID=1121001 RepID=A0A1W1XFX3_9NEIS|nr:hypothetical protein [Andreprevotia lacus]SMC22840.1 hypothetical protein SAMN02745857_01486 [Andreprevotia lacus DSM 23236]